MKTRTEARRSAILDTAATLFKEVGYERASMNELAKRLGGSKTTVYGYFASKEELFSAVVEANSTVHLLDAAKHLALAGQEQQGLEASLTEFGERMLNILTNDRDAIAVYRMVIAEAGISDVGRLFYHSGPAAALQAIATRFESAMETGALRRGDPMLYALQFTALLTAENEARLFEKDPAPLALEAIRAMVARALDTFLHGTRAR